MPRVRCVCGWLLLLCCIPAPSFCCADEKPELKPQRWEKTIQAFEAADRENPPPPGATLFIGSSSIRLWKLEDHFPGKLINRGFGGSHVEDSLYFADRIALPYRPATIVMYAGDNDVAQGKSPQRVADDFAAFVKKVHAELPKARIVYIAIKPSIKRWNLAEPMQQANARVRKLTEQDERLAFADIWMPMLGEDGRPREELFVKDGLHLSDEGYRLWTGVVKPLLQR